MITGHELALEVGISERAIRRIIAELYEGGYIAKGKEGRRVRYQVKHHAHLRHKTQRDKTVGELLKVLSSERQEENKWAVRFLFMLVPSVPKDTPPFAH